MQKVPESDAGQLLSEIKSSSRFSMRPRLSQHSRRISAPEFLHFIAYIYIYIFMRNPMSRIILSNVTSATLNRSQLRDECILDCAAYRDWLRAHKDPRRFRSSLNQIIRRSEGKLLAVESKRNSSVRETARFSFVSIEKDREGSRCGEEAGGLGSKNDEEGNRLERKEDRAGLVHRGGRCERALLGASGSTAVWPSVTTRLRRSLER